LRALLRVILTHFGGDDGKNTIYYSWGWAFWSRHKVNRRYFWMTRGSVARQRQVYRPDELKALPGYSYLTQIGTAWNALSEAVKSDWGDAGAIIGQHGYNLYVQDKSYRIKHELAGDATPSIYHQYLIGYLYVPDGAGYVLLRQSGTRVFSFPATLRVRYKSDLFNDPPGAKTAKVRFKYTYDEGAGEQTQIDEIELTKVSAWGLVELEITEHTGLTGAWELEIEIDALEGRLWFDNIWVDFVDGIFTGDPYCLEVERYWSKINFPAGCTLETIYPTGDAL
jgi:hypothetical protein